MRQENRWALSASRRQCCPDFDFPLRLTIGTDIDTAEIVEEMGGEHVPCPVDDIVVDEDNKIVTTPAYMLANNIAEAASGIEKLVARVLVLTE